MLAERKVIFPVGEIDKLYIALSKTSYSPAEISRTINLILLNEGFTKQELSQAWDQWYLKKGGKRL